MSLNLQDRLGLLSELGQYLSSGGDEELEMAVRQSYIENQWFTEENSLESLRAIATSFLDADKLRAWVSAYNIPEENHQGKVVGLVSSRMALDPELEEFTFESHRRRALLAPT